MTRQEKGSISQESPLGLICRFWRVLLVKRDACIKA